MSHFRDGPGLSQLGFENVRDRWKESFPDLLRGNKKKSFTNFGIDRARRELSKNDVCLGRGGRVEVEKLFLGVRGSKICQREKFGFLRYSCRCFRSHFYI